MSELPAGDTHDVIAHGGRGRCGRGAASQEYRQLRQALEEQQVNEEFDAALGD